jgi:hypothetical protein
VKRSIWWTPRAIKIHLTLAILAPGFVALFWWQLNRALSGNGLSWAYAIEWPVFLVYAFYMWWRLIHDTAEDATDAPPPAGAPGDSSSGAAKLPTGHSRHGERAARRQSMAQQRAETDERELAAYNAYLRTLGPREEATPSTSDQENGETSA